MMKWKTIEIILQHNKNRNFHKILADGQLLGDENIFLFIHQHIVIIDFLLWNFHDH
jgi:hypothetical protein